MKRLGTRVNLIPVIAKADTLTQSDLFTFKQRVRLYLYPTLPYMQPNVFTWYL
jgi:septin family protein